MTVDLRRLALLVVVVFGATILGRIASVEGPFGPNDFSSGTRSPRSGDYRIGQRIEEPDGSYRDLKSPVLVDVLFHPETKRFDSSARSAPHVPVLPLHRPASRGEEGPPRSASVGEDRPTRCGGVTKQAVYLGEEVADVGRPDGHFDGGFEGDLPRLVRRIVADSGGPPRFG